MEFAQTDVRFLAVSIDPDVPNIERVARRLGVGMELLVANGELMGPLGIGHIPSTVFINRQGRLVAAASGEKSVGFYRRRVEALLNAP